MANPKAAKLPVQHKHEGHHGSARNQHRCNEPFSHEAIISIHSPRSPPAAPQTPPTPPPPPIPARSTDPGRPWGARPLAPPPKDSPPHTPRSNYPDSSAAS